MVILSGSNGTSAQLRALPSPARGSPPGVSPNKSESSATPELTGLERMLHGWRRQAEKKAQQFRQRELDGEGKRQKEQQEVNEMCARLIVNRVKKLDQQQQAAAKTVKNNLPGMPQELNMDLPRKRRNEDEFLGTPSDGGFTCDSPHSFISDTGIPAPKKMTPPQYHDRSSSSITTAKKNTSVFIETFQLPVELNGAHTSSTIHPPQVSMYNMGYNGPSPMPAPVGYSQQTPPTPFNSMSSAYARDTQWGNYIQHGQPNMMVTPSTAMPGPPSFYGQNQRLFNNQQYQQQQMTGAHLFRGQMGDMALPQHIEEEMIRSLPVNLDAALTPDFLQAIDALERV